MALSDPQGAVETVEGVCPGKIIDTLRGEHGFGYDPLFVPEGFSKTFAELSSAEKNKISHRARALEKARVAWKDRLLALQG
jgi:XTP/dITP diphosphohydrolase